MSTPRRGLGRGLGSLIPTSDARPDRHRTDGRVTMAAPSGCADRGRSFRRAPARRRSLPIRASLGASSTRTRWPSSSRAIREVGLLQPIVVRPIPDGRYELVMGERRWRAAQEAGLDAIPAIVRETADDALLRDALLENLHRAQLNPLEEAAAYQQMLDDFGCTHDELAQRLRPVPAADLQHASAAEALCAGPAPGRRGRAVRRTRADAARRRRPRAPGRARVAGGGRGHLGARRSRSWWPWATAAAPAPRTTRKAPRRARLGRHRRPALRAVRDALQGRARPCKGRITVEFASLDDLQRILGADGSANRLGLADMSTCQQRQPGTRAY